MLEEKVKDRVLGNQGISIIAIVIILAAVSFGLYQKSDVLFKIARNKKTSNELNISAKIFSNGMFNYTLFAIKERWCMDSIWDKDKSCSSTSDMDKAISNPRNLERLLWSQSTESDINDRYFKLYKKYPSSSPRLNKVSQTFNLSDLDSLGKSHPLTIIINDSVKNCVDKVTVEIERQNPSIIKPQGDEVYLQISILSTAPKFDIFSKCEKAQKSFNLRGLVVIYPRTLNQFALIKAQNLDLNTINASGGKGITFNGPVYVQGDLNIPSTGFNKIAFRDKIRIGEGILKKDSTPFQPDFFGKTTNIYLSQITTIEGFFSGVGLDAEIDAGLSKLFGGTYQYPQNTNMADCINRQKLKEQFSLTKDSRLFFQGSNNNYRMALTKSNEFREYKVFGPDLLGFFVKDLTSDKVTGSNGVPKYNSYVDSQFALAYKNRSIFEYPIMELNLSVKTDGGTGFDQDLDYSKILMGRDSEMELVFANKAFYNSKLEVIDIPKSSYLDLTKLETSKLGPSSSTTKYLKSYDDLKAACGDGILHPSGGSSVGHSDCFKVLNKVSGSTIDCDKAYTKSSDKSNCKDAVDNVSALASAYYSEEAKIISAIRELSLDPPEITVKTKGILSNQEDISYILKNESNFSNIFLQHIQSFSFNTNVYDFAIENAPSNTVSGLRNRSVLLPGPNQTGNSYENGINLVINRFNDKTFKSAALYTNDGLLLDSKIQSNSSNWAMLKHDNKSNYKPEPPGNDYKIDSVINYPEAGLTIEQAKKLDQECQVDISAATPPSWDVSFTDTTQFSWLYNLTSSGIAITDPSKATPLPFYNFDINNNDMTIGFYSGVPTRSIVDNCYVKSSIDFIFGFYVCNNLIIESRTTPLNIVGTFIVNNLQIDSSASNAGVNFYSIWQAEGIKLLQSKQHLKKEKLIPPSGVTDCVFNNISGWNSHLSNDVVSDLLSCSPAKFLYQGANNFNWTTIDPELGIESTGVNQATTQSKIVNRYRRFGINIIWQKEDYK